MGPRGMADDTICAMATPPGEGGIGIMRLSGSHTLERAEQFLRLRSGASLRTVESHTFYLADLFDPRALWSSDSRLDEVFVVYLRGPRSYTGEDVLEVHAHGNAVIAALMVRAAVSSGCRLAEPGEFTKRAFLNGKMDLSQAEAVLETIRANSEEGLRVAQQHLRGDLGRVVADLREQLLMALAHMEAGIDFSEEEDIRFIDRNALLSQLEATQETVTRALETVRTGQMLREGARVALVGAPNVGKSSLLNVLLQRERAIVSSVPGTTRDVIEESISLNGVRLSLVDTAGLRETDDPIEREGIKRTHAAIQSADLVVRLHEAVALADSSVCKEFVPVSDVPCLDVVNKIDLVDDEFRRRLIQQLTDADMSGAFLISTRTGEGVEALRAAIRARLYQDRLEPAGGVVITHVRHAEALRRASESVALAIEAIKTDRESECVAVDLRGAADALGEITGAITSDEILNRIFSQFCIGK